MILPPTVLPRSGSLPAAHEGATLYGTTPSNGGGSYAYRVKVTVGPTSAATYSLVLSSG
jgi:hypothetical protein